MQDALGSVRYQTDPAGNITHTLGYAPYGQLASGSRLTPFGYTGEWTDPTGQVYLRARVYQPSTGRFLTRDPIQPNHPGTQGWNHYSYTTNNPTTLTDPSGLASLPENALLRSALVGGAIGGGLRGAQVLAVCDDFAPLGSRDYYRCVLGFLVAGFGTGAVLGAAGHIGVFSMGGAMTARFAGTAACLSGATLNLAEDDFFAALTGQDRDDTDRVLSIAIGCFTGFTSSGGGTGFGGAGSPGTSPEFGFANG